MAIEADPELVPFEFDSDATEFNQIESKGERTRRRLLELAVDRFGSKGYRGTSVSGIARAAGLTQAAVYAYFDNKEALFRAAVDADAASLIDSVTDQVADSPIRQLVPAVIAHTVATLEHHPLAHRILRGEEPDEVPRLIDLDAVRTLGDLMAEAIADAQTAGEVRADLNPELTGKGLESLIIGLLFATVLSEGVASERHIGGVIEVFDLMLRPPD